MTLNKTLWAALVAAMACGAVSAVAADATTATTAAIKKKVKAKAKTKTAAAVQKKKAATAAKPAAAKPAAVKPAVPAAAAAAKPASVAAPVAEPAPAAAPAVAPAAVAAPAPAPAPVVTAAPAASATATVGRWLSNVYAGGSVGQSRWSLQGGDGLSLDESGNLLKLFVGHRYNEWLAAEVGFVSLGKATASAGTNAVSYKSSGLFLDAVGTYPVYPKVELLGRIGGAYMDNKVDYQQPDLGLSESGSKKSFGLKYGAGVQYRLMPQLTLRGEVESYPYKSPTTTSFSQSQKSRVTGLSIGGAWQF